jgi:hypothetical protein
VLEGPFTGRTSGPIQPGADISLRAEAGRGEPMVGWIAPYQYSPQVPFETVALPGAEVSTTTYTSATATAVFCQQLDMRVTLVGPNGSPTTTALPEDSDFIMVDPVPNCPYADNAWLVGTTVDVAALADPTGYLFRHWSGASAATTFGTSVHLDGATPSRTLTATYDVRCFTLTAHPADLVGRSPAPNCPGEPGSAGRYVGGTTVVLGGQLPSDSVFQGWSGDVENPGETAVNWVVMDRDKTASFDYRDQDLWEEAADVASFVGDQVAIASKKAAGVVAIGAAAFLTNAPPLAYGTIIATIAGGLSEILGLFGVGGDLVEYLGHINKTVSFITAGLTCAGAWGLSSSETPSRPENLVASGSTAGGNEVAGSVYGQSQARQRARDIQKLEAKRTWTAVGPAHDATLKETTGAVTRAKLKYKKAKTTFNQRIKPAVDKLGLAVDVGLEVYNLATSGPGLGWDSDAESAWTNGDAYKECLTGSVPGYIDLGPGVR